MKPCILYTVGTKLQMVESEVGKMFLFFEENINEILNVIK